MRHFSKKIDIMRSSGIPDDLIIGSREKANISGM